VNEGAAPSQRWGKGARSVRTGCAEDICITAAANKLPLLPHLESREAERCRNRSSPRDDATRMYIASRWRLMSVWLGKVRPTSLIASVMAK
jgi:hypothetical protein